MQVDKTALPSKNGVFAAPDKVGPLIFIGGDQQKIHSDRKDLYLKKGSNVPLD